MKIERMKSNPTATPIPAAEATVELSVLPRESAVPKARVKSFNRGPWVLCLINFVLLAVIGYLGHQAVQKVRQARLVESQAAATVGTEKIRTTVQTHTPVRPLQDYRLTWERNLFNTSKPEVPAPKEIEIDKLALASKGLGLKLVGTVVADDAKISRAIIDNRRIREQEVYREGDYAGKVRIKKILRNNVIITTTRGNALLTIELDETGKGRRTSKSRQQALAGARPTQKPSARRRPAAGYGSIRLKRAEVEASLADHDGLLQQLTIIPYKAGEQPAGFRFGNIPSNSVLRKMGLRSRDVITGINDEAITDPAQAAGFFQTLSEGGDVTIKVRRRRRTRQIQLSIG
jgi:type II secretion system protein C